MAALLLLLTSSLVAICGASDSTPQLALIPWPTNVTMLAGSPVALTAKTKIIYTLPGLKSVAAVLASEVASVHGIDLAVVAAGGGNAGAVGDIILQLAPVSTSRPTPTPPTPPPAPAATPPNCTVLPGIQLNNTVYADGSGPRESTGPGDCCAQCAANPGCKHWSYSVDPAFPGPYPPGGWCRWAHLTHCCWFHSADGGSNPIANKSWTSGAVPPPPPPPVMPYSLPSTGVSGFPSCAYNLSVSATGMITVVAETTAGLLAGTTTLLQATGAPRASSSDLITLPLMDVVDQPFREWRGLQLDVHGNPYHSIDSFKSTIRLARYYKLNVLTFNIGPSAWISPLMKSTSLTNASWRSGNNTLTPCYRGVGHCVMYSPDEIADLVAYGSAHGVRLVPMTTLMPGDSEVAQTLNTSMVPNDVGYKFADWMDEVDHLGPSTYNGTQDGPTGERFWAWIQEVIHRQYRLYAKGWPDGLLPTWHIGAVLGEGGMTGAMMRRLYDAIQKAAQAVHGASTPAVKVGFYTGIAFDDPAVADIQHNLINHWYNPAHGIQNFINSGWHIVSLTWAPLYICPGCFNGINENGPYLPEQVFNNFNYWYINKETQDQINPKRGSPMVLNKSFMSQYWVPGREAQTLGTIMSTWEIGVTCQHCNEMAYVRERAGPFAEHAWNYRVYPYPTTGAGSWQEFVPRTRPADLQLNHLIGPIALDWACAQNPHDGDKSECMYTPHGNGTHYLANCGGSMETHPPWQAICEPMISTP